MHGDHDALEKKHKIREREYGLQQEKRGFLVDNFAFFSIDNIFCDPSLELHHGGSSNERSQQMFLNRIAINYHAVTSRAA